MKAEVDEFVQLLRSAQHGDAQANDQLIQLLYQDLKQIASRQRHKFNNLTLNTTGIVHEAWLKLRTQTLNIKDRQHFMATAALAIRHLLINEAKKNLSQKRQQPQSQTYSSCVHGQVDMSQWLLQLHDMLDQLSASQPRLSQVFQLHYFVGLTYNEIAEILQITSKTVQRDWLKAKYLLAAYLTR